MIAFSNRLIRITMLNDALNSFNLFDAKKHRDSSLLVYTVNRSEKMLYEKSDRQ